VTLLEVLAERLHDPSWAGATVRTFAGGRSNVTLLVSGSAGEVVVRRPPDGEHLPGAHDVLREFRLITALTPTGLPLPEPILACDEPFFVMSRVLGHVVRDRFPPGYMADAAGRTGAAWALVDTLAALHAVDPVSVGLAPRHPVATYPAHQVNLWSRQWTLAGGPPDVAGGVAGLLRADLPTPHRASVLHGDYRLDNVILDPRRPDRIRAVLDWELAAPGDPLLDLALFLVYWGDPGDDPTWRRGVGVPPLTASPGFPDRRAVADRYATATGLDLDRLPWYVACALFKLAGIYQGIVARTAGAGRAEFVERARLTVTWAHEVAATGRVPGV
jgi:aminoglycoside phosphotransferase (APT) family kinase protein